MNKSHTHFVRKNGKVVGVKKEGVDITLDMKIIEFERKQKQERKKQRNKKITKISKNMKKLSKNIDEANDWFFGKK